MEGFRDLGVSGLGFVAIWVNMGAAKDSFKGSLEGLP